MVPSPQLSSDSVKQATVAESPSEIIAPPRAAPSIRGAVTIVVITAAALRILPHGFGIPAEDIQAYLFPPLILSVLWNFRSWLPSAVISLGLLAIPLSIIGVCWSRGRFESREVIYISRNEPGRIAAHTESLRIEFNRVAELYPGPPMTLIQREFKKGEAVAWLDERKNPGILIHGEQGAEKLSLSFDRAFPELSGRDAAVTVRTVNLQLVLYPEYILLPAGPVQPPLWYARNLARGILSLKGARSTDDALERLQDAGWGLRPLSDHGFFQIPGLRLSSLRHQRRQPKNSARPIRSSLSLRV